MFWETVLRTGVSGLEMQGLSMHLLVLENGPELQRQEIRMSETKQRQEGTSSFPRGLMHSGVPAAVSPPDSKS